MRARLSSHDNLPLDSDPPCKHGVVCDAFDPQTRPHPDHRPVRVSAASTFPWRVPSCDSFVAGSCSLCTLQELLNDSRALYRLSCEARLFFLRKGGDRFGQNVWRPCVARRRIQIGRSGSCKNVVGLEVERPSDVGDRSSRARWPATKPLGSREK